MLDFIFIHGAPGTGKSTLAKSLSERLKSPYFEFGWIPEFRDRLTGNLTYEEEEQFSFENLALILKNYVKRGFGNIVVTDLREPIIQQIPQKFSRHRYLLVTLTVDDDKILKSRVLDETRSSGYRDWETALKINQELFNRPLMRHEFRLDSTYKTVEELTENVIKIIRLAGNLTHRDDAVANPLEVFHH